MYVNFRLSSTLVVELFNCEYRDLKILVGQIRLWSMTSHTQFVQDIIITSSKYKKSLSYYSKNAISQQAEKMIF